MIRAMLTGWLLLLPSAAVSAETFRADQWQPKLAKDNIVIETAKQADVAYESFRASVDVPVGLAAAIALLQDTAACTQWIYRCEHSEIIEIISPTERTFYQVTSLPFPAKSRDVIFHAEITFETQNAATVRMEAKPLVLAERKHVRIQDAHGTYTLTAITPDETSIVWEQYVDPAGKLPSWLVNSMLEDLPFKSLQRFRAMVTKPPYSKARFTYDETGNPTGISLQ